MKFRLQMAGSPILVCLTLILICDQVAISEPISLDIYDRETLYIHYSFMGNGYVKDGKIMPLGTFGSNLAREMTGSEFALEEMQKARKYGIAGTVTGTVAAGFGIAGIVMIILDRDTSRTYDAASIITSAICNMVADGFNRASRAAMNRAVWIYNRDVMSGYIK